MRQSKSNRIFLAVITLALMIAGTGLTIANNWENDPQIAAIAIALAASFSAAEVAFLWGHKVWERLNRLWRKVVLAAGLAVLVLSMAGAVWSELEVALSKLSNRAVATNITGALKEVNTNATQRERLRNNRVAFTELGKGKIDFRVLPFVICYAAAGLVSIVILAVQVGERGRASTPRATRGDQIPSNPVILEKARLAGFVQPGQTVKAYADVDSNGEVKGMAIHADGQYSGYIPKGKL